MRSWLIATLRVLAGSAVLLAMLYLGVQLVVSGMADDPKNMMRAQSACIRMAKEHLLKLSPDSNPTFGEAANVSSDPGRDVFEFHWRVEQRNLQFAGTIKSSGAVVCKGHADKWVITELVVAGDTLASARSY